MEIGERIRNRRLELSMTQEELAKKVGYTSKTTIAKIESNANQVRQSMIANLAMALDVTPSYLMGWEDQADLSTENADFLGGMLFDKTFMQYCQKMRDLSPRDLTVVYGLIDSLSHTE